jgi:hypothetical protein
MKCPPFLLGAALLFWGWQVGLPLVGAGLGFALEAGRRARARWEFSEHDFHRIWIFCSLLLLAAAVYAFNENDGLAEVRGFLRYPSPFGPHNTGIASARTVAAVMRWLPMIYFLVMAAQAYSSRQAVPLEAVSLIARRRAKKARKLGLPAAPSRTIDLGCPYLGLCLFSASYHPGEGAAFFWGLTVLLAWALWPKRSARFGLAPWAAALVAAVALGYGGQRVLGSLQRYISALNPGWLLDLSRRGFDPAQSRTQLGQIGRLKGSGKIVIRLEPEAGRSVPALLRAASYSSYKAQVWYLEAAESNFDQLLSERNGIDDTTYVLLRGKTNLAALNIACYLPGGKGLLPLPAGTARLEHLLAFLLRTNSLGAVLEDGPGLVVFDALYGPGPTIDSPAGRNDVRPAWSREIPALEQVISQLDLRGRSLDQCVRMLRAFFQTNFTYGYWDQRDRVATANETPLSRFLLRTRRGHCEYFATATVLLLRQLKFDARYAVGYAVHEPAGRGYVVRQRDAHAWCLVWRDGAWEDFDTTPASWVEAEERRARPFEFLSDLWSRLWFEVCKFYWGQGHLRRYIFWSLLPVLGVLLYQIISRIRRQRRRPGPRPPSPAAWPGLDSEFYHLERHLARRGVVRQSSEPLSHWLGRAAADPALARQRPALENLLRLHYRYRFDPLGLNASERESFRRQTRDCLDSIARRPAKR